MLARPSVRLLIAALAATALAAALFLTRASHPLPPPPEPPVIAQVRVQLGLTPVLAAEAALQADPSDSQARLRLAAACAQTGDPVGAALALYPLVETEDPPLLRGGAGRETEGLKDSPPTLPSSVSRLPSPTLITQYARYCLQIGWLQEAAAVLQRLPACPARARLDLASAYAEHGAAGHAIILLRQLGHEKLGADEWLDGAATWYRCRRPAQAVEWAQRGVVRASGNPAARAVLARCLLAAAQPEAALKVLPQGNKETSSRAEEGSPQGELTSAPDRVITQDHRFAAVAPHHPGPLLRGGAPPSAADPVAEFWRGRAEVRCRGAALRKAGRERLARLAAAEPENAAAAFEAGRAWLLAGEPRRAVPLLARAAVSGYQEVLAYELLSRAYEALGRPAEAAWTRGRSQAFRGRFKEAAAALRRSVALDPTKPMAYVDLARALHADGRPREAVAVLQGAQKVVPGSLDVSLLKARLLLSLERVPEVVRELKSAATLDPQRANEPLGNLGTVYFDSQQFDQAAPVLERAVQLEDGDAHSHFYLGRTYARRMEDPARAARALYHLLRAAQQQPDYSRPWMAAAAVLHRMGSVPEAAACLRRAIAGECQSDAPYVRLGELLQLQGRILERRLILKQYAAVRDHDLARTGLEKETRDNPKDAMRHYRLGDLLLREGHADKALPELLLAAGLRPEWQAAQVRLADASALLGYDDLRQEAERAGGSRQPSTAGEGSSGAR